MKVRFAPSPTGLLHVGDARVALANVLHLRRRGGAFLLRIDDTDAGSSRAEFEQAIEYDLRWLGLAWDSPIRQSDRLARYAAAADRLRASGRLYPCFESEEELNAKRDRRLRRGQSAIYDRAMLKLTAAQRATAEAGGKRPYWRFLLSARTVEWHDAILGRQLVKLPSLSDPVLIRADGTPLHTFTSVVDDLAEDVTDIVRGEEHVTNTGLQLDIMEALAPGRRMPSFAHLPPLLDPAGEKLSRRAGALTLRSLRGDGTAPAALAGYLASAGMAGESRAGMPNSLTADFRLGSVPRAPVRFDGGRLLALNRQALAALPFEAVSDRLPPAATPAFWSAVRGHLDLLNEARGWWDVVAGSIVPPSLEREAAYLALALDVLPPEPWDGASWQAWVDRLREATGRSDDALVVPLRQALTGEEHGPGLHDLLPLIGRSRTAERLRLAT